MKRNIINIDQEKCTGCGECIPACPEGAIQMIDGKARLVSDLHCDGLGACIGDCPFGAITTEFREAEPYNEQIVLKNILPQGTNVLIAHLEHLWSHGEIILYNEAIAYLQEIQVPIPEGFTEKGKIPERLVVKPGELKIETCVEGGVCPSENQNLTSDDPPLNLNTEPSPKPKKRDYSPSLLSNWPIKIKLTQVKTQTFHNANLVIAADCVAGCVPDFQQKYLPEKILLMGCPKFDDQEYYIEKLAQIFKLNAIQSIQALIMEIPCCSGLEHIISEALTKSGKMADIPYSMEKIMIKLAK